MKLLRKNISKVTTKGFTDNDDLLDSRKELAINVVYTNKLGINRTHTIKPITSYEVGQKYIHLITTQMKMLKDEQEGKKIDVPSEEKFVEQNIKLFFNKKDLEVIKTLNKQDVEKIIGGLLTYMGLFQDNSTLSTLKEMIQNSIMEEQKTKTKN